MNYFKLFFEQLIGYRQYKCDEAYKEIMKILKERLNKIKI